ncbi:MAG: TrmH family RNA methyltransferase [bacterium]|nr:TrmH family RNA methyltransferase [bacterium]
MKEEDSLNSRKKRAGRILALPPKGRDDSLCPRRKSWTIPSTPVFARHSGLRLAKPVGVCDGGRSVYIDMYCVKGRAVRFVKLKYPVQMGYFNFYMQHENARDRYSIAEKIKILFNQCMILILHNIRSIYNVGSIFRTADALGIVEKIYLCGITPAPLDEIGKYKSAFIKTALGAEKIIQWEKKKSAVSLIKKLRNEKRKWNIIAVEQAKNSIPYYTLNVKNSGSDNFVLIFGEETKGIPKTILKITDKIIEIPMAGKKESLNVSTAFAIVSFFIKYNYIKH